ncbi:MAG: ABC transporter permease [Clostridia bacterium]|nr:ABC transporter permease [Clostridia bacterium]
MYILKNAWKNIGRAKGRNILIGIIVVIISLASCITLSINNSANEIIKSQKESSSIVATISVDRQKMMESVTSGGQPGKDDFRNMMKDFDSLSAEEIEKYSKSEYVKECTYSLTGNINAVTMEAYSSTTAENSSNISRPNNFQGGGMGGFPGGKDMNKMPTRVQGDFSIVGYSSSTAMTDFIKGDSKIVEGEMFDATTSEKVCVISKELALFNGLSVGNTITLCNPASDAETYEFLITGIYQDSTSGSNQDMFMNMSSMDSANKIITSYNAYNDMIAASKTYNTTTEDDQTATSEIMGNLSSSYYLTSADDVEKFENDIRSMGLDEMYSVSSNLSSVTAALEPLENLRTFSLVFLLVVLVIGGIILIVINIINIRERKYEIGVLTAIGMKKSKVGLQFVFELMTVALIALIIGTGIGAAVSVPTASLMLENQIESQTSQSNKIEENFGRPGGGGPGGMPGGNGGGFPGGFPGGNMGGMFGMDDRENVTYIDQINAVVSGKVLLELLGIGLLLTLIASGASIVFISRYSPLKILSERA